MTAIGALSVIGVAGRAGQHRRIVFFGVGGRTIGSGLFHVLRRVKARHDGGNRRPGQAVMQALQRRQRDAKGRPFFSEQAAAGKAFHHGDAHVTAFALPIQLGPLWIDAGQSGIVFSGVIVGDVFGGGHHVKGGIDGKQDHFHQAALHRQFGDDRVVGAHADVADNALLFQFQHILQEGTVDDGFPVGRLVNVMDHTQIDVIGLQTGQKILESRLHLLHIPCPDILAVLPGRTDMSLNVPFFPTALEGMAQIGAHVGLRHPAVQKVDALPFTFLHHSYAVGQSVPLHPFGAKADLADLQAGFSQSSVSHTRSAPCCSLSFYSAPQALRGQVVFHIFHGKNR